MEGRSFSCGIWLHQGEQRRDEADLLQQTVVFAVKKNTKNINISTKRTERNTKQTLKYDTQLTRQEQLPDGEPWFGGSFATASRRIRSGSFASCVTESYQLENSMPLSSLMTNLHAVMNREQVAETLPVEGSFLPIRDQSSFRESNISCHNVLEEFVVATRL